jgi:hypothetical protein
LQTSRPEYWRRSVIAWASTEKPGGAEAAESKQAEK